MILISMSAIIQAKINILHHMGKSNKEECDELQFWPNIKHLKKSARTYQSVTKYIKY